MATPIGALGRMGHKNHFHIRRYLLDILGGPFQQQRIADLDLGILQLRPIFLSCRCTTSG